MPAVTSRSRPAGGSQPTESPLPPAKRARHSPQPHASDSSALKSLLSGNRTGKNLTAATTNGFRDAARTRINQSRAVVGSGTSGQSDVDMKDAAPEVVEISSDSEKSSEYVSSDEEAEGKSRPNGARSEAEDEDAAMADEDVDGDGPEPGPGEGEEAQEAPSFGELLAANNPDPVDVEAAFADSEERSRVLVPTSGNRVLSAPSATSLGTVLTQALKTNDKALLESCFEINDLDSIRSTIERLPSSLVANLLQRLAERLGRRPGRAGNLMIWVQWSLVAHGAYLSSQPTILAQLSSLNRVIRERASGLQPLLMLKGKLDMLSAQMELRRNIQRSTALTHDSDDEKVIYVEGEESSDEEADAAPPQLEEPNPPGRKTKPTLDLAEIGESESSGDEDEDMPFMNGVAAEGESGSEESEDEELVDDEAEETSDDEGDDVSEDEEEEDGDEGEDVFSSDQDMRTTKRSKAPTRSAFGARR